MHPSVHERQDIIITSPGLELQIMTQYSETGVHQNLYNPVLEVAPKRIRLWDVFHKFKKVNISQLLNL